jgi:hypothetical protein
MSGLQLQARASMHGMASTQHPYWRKEARTCGSDRRVGALRPYSVVWRSRVVVHRHGAVQLMCESHKAEFGGGDCAGIRWVPEWS